MSAHPHIYIAHGAYWKQVASFQRTETLFWLNLKKYNIIDVNVKPILMYWFLVVKTVDGNQV